MHALLNIPSPTLIANDVVLALINRFLQFFMRLYKTFAIILRENLYNVFLLVFIVTAWTAMGFYLALLTNGFRRQAAEDIMLGFVNNNARTLEEENMFTYNCWQLIKYMEYYRAFQSVAIAVSFLRILECLEIFPIFGIYLNVFYKAKKDILYFMAFTSIVLVGFSISGYFLIGLEREEFATFFSSLLRFMNMAQGKMGRLDSAAETEIKSIFILFFAIFFVLVVFKLMMAILHANFRELLAMDIYKDYGSLDKNLQGSLRKNVEVLAMELDEMNIKQRSQGSGGFFYLKRGWKNLSYHFNKWSLVLVDQIVKYKTDVKSPERHGGTNPSKGQTNFLTIDPDPETEREDEGKIDQLMKFIGRT